MRAHAKVWLEEGGRLVFGEGACQLLAGIKQQGSISRAAEDLHMSYRMAWGVIRKLETRLGHSLVSSRVGGEEGGGTVLTPAGEDLLARFQELQRRVDEFAQAAFREIFGPAAAG
ncbi:MAG: LysR family transcriptional regulator [Bacillota bacterium]